MRTKFFKKIIPPICFLLITFFIFMPSSLFLGNIDEFAVEYVDILPIIALVTAVALVILMVVGIILFKINNKVFDIYTLLIFGISLALYLQGNYLNPKFDVLNGNQIEWSNFTKRTVISILVWVVCIIAPLIVAHFKDGIMKIVCRWGSYFLAAVQISTLVVLILTTKRTVSTDFALTTKGEFEISKNDNIVMFIVDTLDTTWAENVVINNENYKDKLKDFTYFDDAVAGGAPTLLGVPLLLTGQSYDTTNTLDEYYADAYNKSSLFSDLKKSNYDIKLYTLYEYLNNADRSNIYNAEDKKEYKISSYKDFGSYLYKLTAFYSMPMPLKKNFVFYSDDFSKLIEITDSEHDVYTMDDPLFYSRFKENGLKTTDEDNNTFVLYHLFGAHGPYTMNENAEQVAATSSEEGQTNQIYGSFKIVFEYIEEMKELGIYDNSTIIITADHGGEEIYQNPAIFVKAKGETQDNMTTNSDPITFKNLHNTIVKAAMGDASTNGPTIYEMTGNTDVRYHTTPEVLNKKYFSDNTDVVSKPFCVFKIEGKSKGVDNITPVLDTDEMKKIND